MCFNQRGITFTLNGGPLKLIDKFTYLGSSVSSTENDINMQLAKAKIAIDRISVIRKSVLSDKIKRSFFQAAVISILLYGFTTWTLSARRIFLTAITQECFELYWISCGGNTPQNSSCSATNNPSAKSSKLDEPNLPDNAGEIRTNSQTMYICGPLHTNEKVLDNQLEHIYNSSVRIQDVAWKTCREQLTKGTGGERGPGKSVLVARHDDDDDDITWSKQFKPWKVPVVVGSIVVVGELTRCALINSMYDLKVA